MDETFPERLRYPVHFVAPEAAIWPELRGESIGEIDGETLSARALDTLNVWVVRTFYELRRRGNDVTIAPAPRSHAINVAAPRDFGRRQRSPEDFVVIPRCDAHRQMLANFSLVQNPAIPAGIQQDWMAHWPQAGIRPRDPGRTGLSRVAFKGRTINLDSAFRSPPFLERLGELGVRFENDAFEGLQGDHSWSDYREVDAVLAVRNLTVRDALHKPPSKLVNAWFADVPAILGPEPAYRALRESDLDYIEVRTPDEALAAIERLRGVPGLYAAMVENGRRRREAFTADRIAARWVHLLNTRAGPLFERWKRRPAAYRHLVRGAMFLAEPVSKRWYQYYIRNGRRILDA